MSKIIIHVIICRLFVQERVLINKDNDYISYAIDNSKRLTLTIYKYLADERQYVDDIVKMYLKQTDLEHLTNQLTYCIHELAGNACRANTKRGYFKHKNLDITNDESYQIGMETFREEAFDNLEKFHTILKEHGLYIKFQIKKNMDSIDLSILNNVELTPQEELKIQEKFEAVKDFDNVADAFTVLEDTSEGAGLGIAMMVIMLKEMGLTPDSLKIFRESEETHAVLKLPLNLVAS